MIKVGMQIAERYEVIEKIGTGGMSDVYRAKDHKLNRFVAVKVLKQEFSENADFVSKFRIEAQAAAGLMHPNIVNVYDVGEENDFHYIVMELVEGITLKKYIEKKARLSVKEAISIAIQVSMGIEAAHNNHIIHRDIKPQNIIISKEGKVKVTDFGIAKAATSNTITSNVMGSVHYTSPEQVRGGFSDEKSDIYSLGITLFEMLTGRVPFNGDTTVAVAIKHIQDAMPSPREFVAEIPVSVENIVLKCTQKSPDRRYQSAPALIEDLKKSLISPDENFVKIEESVVSGATKNITEAEMTAIKQQTRQRDNFDAKLASTTGSLKNENVEPKNKDKNKDKIRETESQKLQKNQKKISDQPSASQNTSKSSVKNSDNGDKRSSGNKSSKNGKNSKKSNSGVKKSSQSGSKKKKKEDKKSELIFSIITIAIAIVIGIVFLMIVIKATGLDKLGGKDNKSNDNSEATEYIMENLVGLDIETAEAMLSEKGVTVSKQYQESSEIAENTVISSDPAVGAVVTSDAVVVLVVSSGVNGVLLPDVVGYSKAEATIALEDEGYVVNIIKENSDTVARDVVIRQSIEGGSSVPRGTTIDIYVSLGGETVSVQMPNIVGMTQDDAVAALMAEGLVPVAGVSDRSSYDLGIVYYQSYSAGVTVNSGTEVEYRVSAGHVLYNCVYSVAAPADYSGGDAEVVLVSSTGQQLFSSTTSSFPVEINISNIDASSGQLTISYSVNETQEVTDGDGNISTQNVQVKKTSGPETIEFTAQ